MAELGELETRLASTLKNFLLVPELPQLCIDLYKICKDMLEELDGRRLAHNNIVFLPPCIITHGKLGERYFFQHNHYPLGYDVYSVYNDGFWHNVTSLNNTPIAYKKQNQETGRVVFKLYLRV